MTQHSGPIYALVVGIDHWINERVPTLQGCVADAGLVTQLFQDQFGVAADNIQLLTDKQATRAAIETAFRKHLIERARSMSVDELARVAFVFHYSGHGSRAFNKGADSATGFDETLVPHDSRTGDVFDIKDWELGGWIDELTQYSTNVTIVLDCCHSGSGTRDGAALPTRQCFDDLRPQPQRPQAQRHSTRSSATVDVSDRYTLIAACRADEVANELRAEETGSSSAHGAMTYFLMQELSHLPARELTYRELHERLRHRVNGRFSRQVPQCEGAIDRLLFGGVTPLRNPLRSVVEISEGYHWIDAGQAHGMTAGTQLDVFPSETRTVNSDTPAIAQLTVDEVGAIRSACIASDSTTPIELHSKVRVSKQSHAISPRRVSVTGDEQLAARLRREPFHQLVVVTDETPDIRISFTDGRYDVVDEHSRIVTVSYAANEIETLIDDLKRRVAFLNAMEIRNTAPDSALAGGLGIAIKQLAFDPKTQEPIAVSLPENARSESIVCVGERLVIELTNHSDQQLYVNLFNFAHDGAINRVYPSARGMLERFAAGRTVSIGLSRKKSEQIWVQPQDPPESLELLKAFGTVEETNFDDIEQIGVSKTRSTDQSKLSRLLAMAATGHRGLGAPPSSAEDQWTTAELDFRVVQPAEKSTQKLASDRAVRFDSYNLSVDVPAGFSGEMRVLTSRQTVRTVRDFEESQRPTSITPSTLAMSDETFLPMPLPATTRTSTDASVIEIDCDDASRETVSEETPIRLQLPSMRTDEFAGTLVLAEQNGMLFPVGRSGKTSSEIVLEWLPPEGVGEQAAIASTRSVGRTLRLYLYKLANIPSIDLGLRRVRFVANSQELPALENGETAITTPTGTILSRRFIKSDLRAGERLLIFVHGFQSDTHWMVSGPAEWLREAGRRYDQVLTFDYESFNTSVGDNARDFAKQLKEAGFAADDNVHVDVIAHSMGGVVTRAMIELNDGAALVDRCVFAGSPHCGTPLANGIQFVPWVGTLLMKLTGSIPPALMAAWVLRKVTNDAIGPKDLSPSSEIIKMLNASASEASVKYLLLAGNNTAERETISRWQRLAERLRRTADATLDHFFGDEHDMVVGTQSASTIRNGNYPRELLKSALVETDHFGYFDDEKSRAAILDWLN